MPFHVLLWPFRSFEAWPYIKLPPHPSPHGRGHRGKPLLTWFSPSLLRRGSSVRYINPLCKVYRRCKVETMWLQFAFVFSKSNFIFSSWNEAKRFTLKAPLKPVGVVVHVVFFSWNNNNFSAEIVFMVMKKWSEKKGAQETPGCWNSEPWTSQFCPHKRQEQVSYFNVSLFGEPKNFLREIMSKIEASVF